MWSRRPLRLVLPRFRADLRTAYRLNSTINSDHRPTRRHGEVPAEVGQELPFTQGGQSAGKRSFRKVHLSQEGLVARIRLQAAKLPRYGEVNQIRVSLPNGSLQPFERTLGLAEVSKRA